MFVTKINSCTIRNLSGAQIFSALLVANLDYCLWQNTSYFVMNYNFHVLSYIEYYLYKLHVIYSTCNFIALQTPVFK